MAEINSSSYQVIADLYAEAAREISNLADYYFVAAREVLELDQFSPELDLLKPFYNAYLAANTAYSQVPSPAVTAIQSLQNHVLKVAVDDNSAAYSDINDWLSDNGVAVDQEFADISERAGFTITAGNIG